MTADWHPAALADWRRLDLDDARAVAVAVQRWIDANEGFVIAQAGQYPSSSIASWSASSSTTT